MIASPALVIVPLVWRGRVSTRAKTLGGVVMNPWDSENWNVADWYRVKSYVPQPGPSRGPGPQRVRP